MQATGAAGRGGPWAILRRLSSAVRHIDTFVEARSFERGNWLVVGFAAGIALWLVLPGPWQWLALLGLCAAIILGACAIDPAGAHTWLRIALIGMATMIFCGCLTVWTKSALVGTPAIDRPQVGTLTGKVETRREQGAQDRVRLTLLARFAGKTPGQESSAAMRVRLNLAKSDDSPAFREGAVLRLRARLMPPAPPMLPGAYDFARTAWFAGVAATGTVIGKPELVAPADDAGLWPNWRRALSDYVRSQLAGTPGAIAVAFATGDRGEISLADEEAMRDSGLTHLLSISGLHVSAVVAAGYAVAIRLLALWQWLALRTKLPVLAATFGALLGIGYTLLTGAEVPTVRSCIGAVLVLAALALGRDPLSMRMVAVAALFVLIFWPEALFGPSFQMSFAAVIAIVALHSAAPVRRFLRGEDEGLALRMGRNLLMLLVTGVVIELALMPIGLFHFHRAGVYGALANVIAIPLTTFITMPMIALALFLDLAGLGEAVWWVVGKSLELLLALAHMTARQPGAVTLLPAMQASTYALFVTGGLWLGLWTGRVRLWGLVPVGFATALLFALRPPDVLVSGDGRHVALLMPGGEGAQDQMVVLREGRGDYARSNLQEIAGFEGAITELDKWPGAQCNRDFCSVIWPPRQGALPAKPMTSLLIARGRDRVDSLALAAACERADIVIADRRLPRTCRPRWFKADRQFLERTGGLAIHLEQRKLRTVSQSQGQHGWYRWTDDHAPNYRPATGMPPWQGLSGQ